MIGLNVFISIRKSNLTKNTYKATKNIRSNQKLLPRTYGNLPSPALKFGIPQWGVLG